MLKRIEINLLRRDVLPRDNAMPDIVDRYIKAYYYKDPSPPPPVVFWDKKDYWLADGGFRVRALAEMKAIKVLCDVRLGTRIDAVWYAAGANVQRSVPPTDPEKLQAVRNILDVLPGESTRRIANHAGVSLSVVMATRSKKASNQISHKTKQFADPPPVKVVESSERTPEVAAFVYGYIRGLEHNKETRCCSVERQERAIEKYKTQLMQFDKTLLDGSVFCDLGNLPGKRRQFRRMPAAQQLLLKLSPGDHVVIGDCSTACPSLRDFFGLIEEWQSQGVHAHFARERVAANSPAGQLMLKVLRNAVGSWFHTGTPKKE